MQCKAVLFDAVGTLIHPRPTVAEVYHRIGLRHGTHLKKHEVFARFNRAVRRGRSLITSESGEREWWRSVVAEVFVDVQESMDVLFDKLWTHFSEASHWALFEDVEPTWDRLAKLGYTLGIASNFDRRLLTVCQGLPLLNQCQYVYWSADLGFAKPSCRFFQQVQLRLGLRPDQILLVGDDPVNDYQGASNAGWHALLVDRDSAPRGRLASDKTEMFSSLHALPALLAS